MLKKINEKIELFGSICQDWRSRNIDFNEPHIIGIKYTKDSIVILCGIYCISIDDYVYCEGGTFKDKLLLKKFKKLNLNNNKEVSDFLDELNNLVDWGSVGNEINRKKYKEVAVQNEEIPLINDFSVVCNNEKINFSCKDQALYYYETMISMFEGAEEEQKKYKKVYDSIEKSGKEYSDGTDIITEWDYSDYDSIDAKVPCKKLGEGWFWYKCTDGGGYLHSPYDTDYMSYDLATNEYRTYRSQKNWELFPLSYYYVDGLDPSTFNAFDYMEQEMIDYVLPRENRKVEEEKSL